MWIIIVFIFIHPTLTLTSLSSKDIKTLCKVIREDADNEIAFMNQKYLDAMRVWVQEKKVFNIDICAADFNIIVAKRKS